MKLSVCVEMIFTDLPFTERIAAVAEAGYGAFEFWGWRNKDLPAVKEATRRAQLSVAGIAMDTRGLLVDPATHRQIVADAQQTFAVARDLGCPTVLTTTGNERAGVARAEQHAAIVAGLRAVAPHAEAAGVTVALEPLNLLVDHAGYYLASADEGAAIVREVDSPAVRLLFDIYHQQITEGNITARLDACKDLIGHIHIAGVPGRHEPGSGELNYPFLMERLRAWPYTRYVGLEYRPVGGSRESLRQTAELLGGSGV
jgi:hydroxypyruvate isomerase